MLFFLIVYFYIRNIEAGNACTNENFTMNDLNLTPGIFFPNQKDGQQSTTTQTQNIPQNPAPPAPQQQNISVPSNIPFVPNCNAQQPVAQYPQISNNSYYPPQNTNYAPPSYVMQTPNGNLPANTCDNSLEREKFKECVANALKSLRAIIENCRKTLGENAPECKIDDKCLDALKSKPNVNNDRRVNDDRRSSFPRMNDNDGSLDEFIVFLEKKMRKACKEKDKSGDDEYPRKRGRKQNKRRRNRSRDDDYDNDDYDRYDDKRERRIRNQYDPCDNMENSKCESQC